MMRSLWISKTGMEAQQTQLDTISNNLANASTNGYKKSHAVFEDLMYQNLRQVGANSSEQTTLPTGLQVGLGTRAVATARNFTQGNLQQSGNPLDLAVRGNGFFQVQMPDGTVGYTRDGVVPGRRAGRARDQQRLRGAARHHDSGRRAERDDRAPTARSARCCRARRQPQSLGQIQLASFVNPAGLEPKGQNIFTETAASGTPSAGAPGLNGLGLAAAGLRRDVERQRRRGARLDDPDAACLRAQLEGDPDLRPDAAKARPSSETSPCVSPIVRLCPHDSLCVPRCSRVAGRRCSSGCQALNARRRSTSRSRPRCACCRSRRRSRATARSTRPGSTARCSRTTARAWSATR